MSFMQGPQSETQALWMAMRGLSKGGGVKEKVQVVVASQ